MDENKDIKKDHCNYLKNIIYLNNKNESYFFGF